MLGNCFNYLGMHYELDWVNRPVSSIASTAEESLWRARSYLIFRYDAAISISN